MQEQQASVANENQLDLEKLFTDLPVMTEWRAGECYSALLVCLEHHNHQSGTQADLCNLDETLAALELVWSKPIDDNDRRNWGAPRNAVEDAAEGIAWLIIHRFTEYTVIERSNIGSGVDFWLGDKEDVGNLVFHQRKARMEVKGRGNLPYESQIRQVVDDALEQTTRSDYTGLPAYIVVTEFGRPVIYLVQR